MSWRVGRAEVGGGEAEITAESLKENQWQGRKELSPNILPVPVLDGRGNADWFGRHENVRFQENSG